MIDTWTRLIELEMANHGETMKDVVSMSPGQGDWLNTPLHGTEYQGFTVWTKNRVYFPAVYDAEEWCASVPREPCNKQTAHVGG